MLYEPVGYIVEYEVSALVFLIVIMMRYFAARRFPNQKNHMFALILCIAVIDIILDVISSLIIDNVFLVPVAVTFIVNATFYFLQILLPFLMTLYALAMSEHLTRQRLKKLFPLFIPCLLMLIMLLSNPFTSWFFYVDPVRGYVHGDMFIHTYITCLFYIGATFFVTFHNRKRLRYEEYTTIYKFLAVVSISMIIQFMYPALLITGVAIALAVILMYFTIQNPDTMLDATTGAFTYEAMISFLNDRMQEKDRVQLVAVKIHNMPRINELTGIENGSLLLRNVSRFLREGVKDSWVFRMRGGCFVAITSSNEDYHAMSELLEKRISQPWIVGGTEILLQATVCSVEAEELLLDPVSPEEAVNYIETAFLHEEISSDRVRIITLGTELMDKFKRSRKVEKALREAIKTGEGLELYFQPMWSVKQKRFTSAEVLLRFNHPVMGFISPEEFVPIAESSGLVTAMDELVVRKTCEFIRLKNYCQEFGLQTLEINLSALEFMQNRLPKLLRDIMSQYQVDPRFLCFEITETAATESFELLKECMLDLRKTGCRFAIDDFGTGYANISQVIQLPFSIVKLDRSMLFGSEIVLEDMARMFARMDRITVVEGVETSAQAKLTESIGVDYIQGYYYAKPMNQEGFIKFMQENHRTK